MVTVATEGSLPLTGALQVIHENVENKVHEGSIDLTPLIGIDSLLVRLETRVKSGGAYVKTGADRTFTAPISDQDKMLNFLPRAVKYGFRVSVQQLTGTNRTLDFIFFKT